MYFVLPYGFVIPWPVSKPSAKPSPPISPYTVAEDEKIILETLLEILPENDERRKNIGKQLITYVEDRKGHDRRYAIAPDKIKADIGWYPETMFKDGIKLTIKWFLENEEWMKNVTSGDYQKYYNEMYK